MGDCCDINNRAPIKYSTSDSICTSTWSSEALLCPAIQILYFNSNIYHVHWQKALNAHMQKSNSLCRTHGSHGKSTQWETTWTETAEETSAMWLKTTTTLWHTQAEEQHPSKKKTNLIPSSRYIWRKWCHFKRLWYFTGRRQHHFEHIVSHQLCDLWAVFKAPSVRKTRNSTVSPSGLHRSQNNTLPSSSNPSVLVRYFNAERVKSVKIRRFDLAIWIEVAASEPTWKGIHDFKVRGARMEEANDAMHEQFTVYQDSKNVFVD